ncbi:MAG: TRAP transporter large permease subunit, partial [Dehalococcoidia bacterium]|nr:TRAP transporter large permease subunit [Dehalococcoidia bacterium]
MEVFFWLLIIILVISGAPLYVALGLGSALIMVFVQNLAPNIIIQTMFNQIASWPLLAMPLFILAGNLMIAGGSARSLLKFFDSWAGHLPGGMLVVVVLFCTLFSAISGSGYAAIAAVGTMMFPEMKKLGYSDKLATGTVAVTGDLGILIPPSILFIVLGMLMQT